MLHANREPKVTHPVGKPGAMVKVVICDHAGKTLQDCRLGGEFADRNAAVEAIKRHLQQFEQAGFDGTQGFWWGRTTREPREETRFFVM